MQYETVQRYSHDNRNRWLMARPTVALTKPLGPLTLWACTQSRRICRCIPPIRAAAPRLCPSKTAAKATGLLFPHFVFAGGVDEERRLEGSEGHRHNLLAAPFEFLPSSDYAL
jgi:hypothetical protein